MSREDGVQSLLRLTERYCVVLQTLTSSAEIDGEPQRGLTPPIVARFTYAPLLCHQRRSMNSYSEFICAKDCCHSLSPCSAEPEASQQANTGLNRGLRG